MGAFSLFFLPSFFSVSFYLVVFSATAAMMLYDCVTDGPRLSFAFIDGGTEGCLCVFLPWPIIYIELDDTNSDALRER